MTLLNKRLNNIKITLDNFKLYMYMYAYTTLSYFLENTIRITNMYV